MMRAVLSLVIQRDVSVQDKADLVHPVSAGVMAALTSRGTLSADRDRRRWALSPAPARWPPRAPAPGPPPRPPRRHPRPARCEQWRLRPPERGARARLEVYQ